MSNRKLVDGFKAMGFAVGFGDKEVPANLEVRNGKIELTLLLLSKNPLDLLTEEKESVPGPILFSSTEVKVNLSKFRVSRQKSEIFSGIRAKTFSVERAVCTPANIDHSQIHGMTSELEGFDRWAEQQSISRNQLLDDEYHDPLKVILKAEVQQPVLLGSSFNIQANAGFMLPAETAYSTSYTIYNVTILRSQTSDLRSWDEHQQVHRMIQDLICLAYGYPCSIRLKETLRADNQPDLPPDIIKTSGTYYWHEAFEQNFGRSRDVDPRKGIKDYTPLFKLSDTNPTDMENWIENFDKWSRPTWIAVESIFQPYLAAESRMLLIGSALEALGYGIWLYEEHDGYAESCDKGWCRGSKSGCHKPGCNKPKATGYFEKAAKGLPWKGLDISSEESAHSWATEFNRVYKGCKHADNPLPDGLEAFDRAKEGLMVIRCWLAKKLGVSDETLTKNISTIQGL